MTQSLHHTQPDDVGEDGAEAALPEVMSPPLIESTAISELLLTVRAIVPRGWLPVSVEAPLLLDEAPRHEQYAALGEALSLLGTHGLRANDGVAGAPASLRELLVSTGDFLQRAGADELVGESSLMIGRTVANLARLLLEREDEIAAVLRPQVRDAERSVALVDSSPAASLDDLSAPADNNPVEQERRAERCNFGPYETTRFGKVSSLDAAIFETMPPYRVQIPIDDQAGALDIDDWLRDVAQRPDAHLCLTREDCYLTRHVPPVADEDLCFGETEFEWPLRSEHGAIRIPLHEHYEVVALSFLDTNGTSLPSADGMQRVDESYFGSAVLFDVPRGAETVRYRVTRSMKAPAEGFDAKLAHSYPRSRHPLESSERALHDSIVELAPDLRARAWMDTRGALDYRYLYSEQIGSLVTATPSLDLATSILRFGNCFSLNHHGALHLSRLGCHAFLLTGNSFTSDGKAFQDPGHCQILTFDEGKRARFDMTLKAGKPAITGEPLDDEEAQASQNHLESLPREDLPEYLHALRELILSRTDGSPEGELPEGHTFREKEAPRSKAIEKVLAKARLAPLRRLLGAVDPPATLSQLDTAAIEGELLGPTRTTADQRFLPGRISSRLHLSCLTEVLRRTSLAVSGESVSRREKNSAKIFISFVVSSLMNARGTRLNDQARLAVTRSLTPAVLSLLDQEASLSAARFGIRCAQRILSAPGHGGAQHLEEVLENAAGALARVARGRRRLTSARGSVLASYAALAEQVEHANLSRGAKQAFDELRLAMDRAIARSPHTALLSALGSTDGGVRSLGSRFVRNQLDELLPSFRNGLRIGDPLCDTLFAECIIRNRISPARVVRVISNMMRNGHRPSLSPFSEVLTDWAQIELARLGHEVQCNFPGRHNPASALMVAAGISECTARAESFCKAVMLLDECGGIDGSILAHWPAFDEESIAWIVKQDLEVTRDAEGAAHFSLIPPKSVRPNSLDLKDLHNFELWAEALNGRWEATPLRILCGLTMPHRADLDSWKQKFPDFWRELVEMARDAVYDHDAVPDLPRHLLRALRVDPSNVHRAFFDLRLNELRWTGELNFATLCARSLRELPFTGYFAQGTHLYAFLDSLQWNGEYSYEERCVALVSYLHARAHSMGLQLINHGSLFNAKPSGAHVPLEAALWNDLYFDRNRDAVPEFQALTDAFAREGAATLSRPFYSERTFERRLAARSIRYAPDAGGGDFDRLRDYVPGDDARHIDWRALARSDRLKVKVRGSVEQKTISKATMLVDFDLLCLGVHEWNERLGDKTNVTTLPPHFKRLAHELNGIAASGVPVNLVVAARGYVLPSLAPVCGHYHSSAFGHAKLAHLLGLALSTSPYAEVEPLRNYCAPEGYARWGAAPVLTHETSRWIGPDETVIVLAHPLNAAKTCAAVEGQKIVRAPVHLLKL